MPTHADDALYLRLARCHGLGARGVHRLLSELGDIQAIFAASEYTLAKIIGDKPARSLLNKTDEATQQHIEATLTWLVAPDHHVLTWAHPSFPAALLESGDAPVLLYAKGDLSLLQKPALAIVGSRNCSGDGNDTAEAFAQNLAAAGVCIVSGMAAGIDTAAHVGALRAGPGDRAGSTIAVVGTGLDRVYPASNKKLAHQIAALGLLLSECPLGTPPMPENFPRRNRIISGLSLGTLVVEASLKSGSLITARLAGEQGREVFAIPGSIHSTFHKGCHQLIKQGAKLVETASDILEELRLSPATGAIVQQSPPAQPADGEANDAHCEPAAQTTSPLTTANNPVLTALAFAPTTLEALSQRTGLGVAELMAAMTLLELDGTAEQLADGRWQRRGA